MRTIARSPASLWLSLSLLAVGCGTGVKTDYSQLELVNVSGKVTLDGKPLADGVVQFEAPDGTYSFGCTNRSGNYHLMFNSEKRGVLPGPKVVRIGTAVGSGDEESAFVEGEDVLAVSLQERVPSCYNTNSQLKVTVERRSRKANFDLKSDCSVTGPS